MSSALIVIVAAAQALTAPAVEASAAPAVSAEASAAPAVSVEASAAPAVSAEASAAPAADAAAPARDPAAGAPGVEITIAAPSPEAAVAVREDLEELLARHGVTARYRRVAAVDRDEVLRPSAESPCALACIWLDLGGSVAGRAFVYISATASDQVVIRSLPLPSGVDEVAREEVAQIVATSVEALQAGRPLPSAASPTDAAIAKTTRAPPPTTPAAPAAADTGLWIAAGLGAGAAHEGAQAVALPTAGLSLLLGPEGRRWSPALWLTVGAFSSDASSDLVAVRFRGGELAALAAVGTTLGARVVARVGLGPGLELRQATPAVSGGAPRGVQLDDPRIVPTFYVRAAARFEVRLFGRVGLFASAACDVRVVSERYTVNHDGVTEGIFQPDFLRPSLLIGVDATLAGEGRP